MTASIEVPINIQEFNTIAGLIFAKLSQSHPLPTDIDGATIASLYGIEETAVLPSGRVFSDLFTYTLIWLNDEHYTSTRAGHPAQRAVLTTRGLQAMNAVPSSLSKTTVAVELQKASKNSAINLSMIGELVGSAIGGLTKTLTS
jgi:hypothetical protein